MSPATLSLTMMKTYRDMLINSARLVKSFGRISVSITFIPMNQPWFISFWPETGLIHIAFSYPFCASTRLLLSAYTSLAANRSKWHGLWIVIFVKIMLQLCNVLCVCVVRSSSMSAHSGRAVSTQRTVTSRSSCAIQRAHQLGVEPVLKRWQMNRMTSEMLVYSDTTDNRVGSLQTRLRTDESALRLRKHVALRFHSRVLDMFASKCDALPNISLSVGQSWCM